MRAWRGLSKVAVAVVTALIAVSVTAASAYYCLKTHEVTVTKYVTVSVPKTVRIKSTVTVFRTLTSVLTRTLTRVFTVALTTTKTYRSLTTSTAKQGLITPKITVPRNDSAAKYLVSEAFKEWLTASVLKSLRAAYVVGGSEWFKSRDALNALAYSSLISGLSMMTNMLAWIKPPLSNAYRLSIAWTPIRWYLSSQASGSLSSCGEISVKGVKSVLKRVYVLPLNSSAARVAVKASRHGYPVKGVGEVVRLNLTVSKGNLTTSELDIVSSHEGIIKYLLTVNGSRIRSFKAAWSVGGFKELFSPASNKLVFMGSSGILGYVSNASEFLNELRSAVKVTLRFLRYEVIPGGVEAPEYLVLVTVNLNSEVNGVKLIVKADVVCNAYLLSNSLAAISNTVIESINSTVSYSGVKYCYIITSPVKIVGPIEGVEELTQGTGK